MKVTKEIKSKLAAKATAAIKTGKPVTKIVQDAADEFEVSPKTIYRWIKKHGCDLGRKTRSDCGKSSVPDEILYQVAKSYHLTNTLNAKESRKPLARAIQYWEQCTGKKFPVSTNHTHQLFRREKISRFEARRKETTEPMIFDYPNQYHSLDFTISKVYLDPKSQRLIPMWDRDYTKKPEKLKKKQQLKAMALIDNFSGAFYVQYYTDQQTASIADFLYNAWSPKIKTDYIFHGAPENLFIDNDTALKSHAMLRLFNYLKINIPNIGPYKPWIKGSVEQFFSWWQGWFESMFYDIGTKKVTLKLINEWALEYASYLQQTAIHTRHGKTRFACWNENIGDHLREMPEWQIYKTLLHTDKQVRTVRNSRFSFTLPGQPKMEYKIKGLPDGAKIDVYIHAFLFKENKAVTIQYPSSSDNSRNYSPDEVITKTVLPIVKNAGGYDINAQRPNEKNKRSETKRDKNLKKIEETKAPENQPNPFILPLPENAPVIMPKAGKPINVIGEFNFKEIEYTLLQVKKKIRIRLGRRVNQDDKQIIEAYQQVKQIKDDAFTGKDIEAIIALIKQPALAE